MNTTRPLSGRGKEINYWFQGGRTIVQWGAITFSMRSENFAAVLDDFFVDPGRWYSLGDEHDGPSGGWFGPLCSWRGASVDFSARVCNSRDHGDRAVA